MTTLQDAQGRTQSGQILAPEAQSRAETVKSAKGSMAGLIAPEDSAEPRPFTWHDARLLAAIVRDGLLMIVRGLERQFDLAKK